MFSKLNQRILVGASVAFLVSLLCVSVYAGNLDQFAKISGTLDIAGGTAHIPVMKEAAQNIMAYNPKVRITIAGGGSGVGVQKVGKGLVQIGNTGRPLTQQEVDTYGLKTFPFAVDGVAVIVNPKNPLKDLKPDQIAEIFAGRIKNWKDVGGSDAEIHLYTRDEASGTREVFWKKLLKKGAVADKANVVPSNGAMKVSVAQDPDAIGYMSIGHVDASVKPISIDGVVANQENALNGTYGVVRKLYMNTKGNPSPIAQAFLEYVFSTDGTAIISKYGYIPLSK